MPFEPPMAWIAVLNILSLPAIQLICAYVFTRIPARWFERPLPPASLKKRKHHRLLRIGTRHLPDGAAWFAGGFRKRALASSDPAYLRRFITETRRGEACHWAAMVLCTLPFSWNPWWGCLIIAIYAVFANVPCILLQRVNRARLMRVAGRRRSPEPACHNSADAKSARS